MGGDPRFHKIHEGDVEHVVHPWPDQPIEASPEIKLSKENHQFGAWLRIEGSGFYPSSTVYLYVDGAPNKPPRYSLGFANADSGGAFDTWWDVRCTSAGGAPNQTVVAEGRGDTQRATASTDAWSC
jgi:hypothetical protein